MHVTVLHPFSMDVCGSSLQHVIALIDRSPIIKK